jgi:signal peptidase I
MVLGLLAVASVVGLLVSALLLWLACLIFRVRHPAEGDRPAARVGFGRALALTLLLSILNAGLLAVALALGGSPLYWAMGLALGWLLLPVLVFRLCLPVGLPRAVGVDLLWNLFKVPVAGLLLAAGLTFACEGLVVPTGGMAESIIGYHKRVVCPSCGLEFAVNASSEVEMGAPVSQCTCPNCRLHVKLVSPGLPRELRPQANTVPDPGLTSGDRILAGKGLLGPSTLPPRRLDVVVFDYPGDPGPLAPPDPGKPIKYVKRLIGLPGETVAIHRGKLYVLSPERTKELGLHHEDEQGAELWRPEFMHREDEKASKAFGQGKFEIVRKPAGLVKGMMCLVHDNDFQPKDLDGPEAKRWAPADRGWAEDGKTGFRHDGRGEMGWLRYRNVLRGDEGRPSLITDFLSYNTGFEDQVHGHNWAGDLIVECEVEASEPSGEFALELSRGDDRFRATFDLATGECTLSRVSGEDRHVELKKADTRLKGKGRRRVRFANVDDRLLVWVDGRLPFGEDGVPYEAALPIVPTEKNDLARPVSIGSKGAEVSVHHLRVLRDVYYVTAIGGRPDVAEVRFDPKDPETFAMWKEAPTATFFVQPDHYFFLGDNSTASSDSRLWGVVARQRIRGKVLFRYSPLDRVGWVR